MDRATFGWVIASAALACALAGCHGDEGHSSTPAGAELVRSSLAFESAPEVTDDERAQLTRDNRDFAFDLYAQLAAARAGQNLLLSPFSISTALAMTYAGAEGSTRSEMATALHFALPDPAFHRAFNAALQALQQSGKHVSILNASFADKNSTFHDDYLDLLAQNYDAGMYLLDFSNDPDRSRKSINDWVYDQTDEHIADLLPAAAIDKYTAMVLANAVYFKAPWATSFDEHAATSATFHAPSGDVAVTMMAGSPDLEYDYQYAAGAGYQAVAMPFEPATLSMLCILPSEGRFDEIEHRLDRSLLEEIEQNQTASRATINMPRVRFESAFDLKDGLQALGMTLAWEEENADFSRMADTPPPLFIKAVQHKTFVSLAEGGVEAAAATAVVVNHGVSASIVIPAMVLDRPFFFAIIDQPSGALLFLGRVSDPS